MKRIPIHDLEPDVELAEDARDASGRKLVSMGTRITHRHIRAFKIWDVKEVAIVSDDENCTPKSDPLSRMTPELWALARSRTETRFRMVDLSSPVMRTLFDLGLLQSGRRVAKEAIRDGKI